MAVLKYLLAVSLFATGGVFLAHSIGVTIPLVKYKGFEAQSLPVGIVFLAAGLGVLVFWKITRTSTVTKTWDTSPGGSKHTSTTTTTTTTLSKPPF